MSSKKEPDGNPNAGPTVRPEIDAAAVRELAKLLAETGLTEIEIAHGDARIRVSRGGGLATSVNMPAGMSLSSAAGNETAPSAKPSPAGPPVGAVPSPMVGTVYIAPEPGKPPFISLGKTVKEGDTLFIVEAMKTMNAIAAPRSGTVKEINVTDGTPVEFGQTLCVIA